MEDIWARWNTRSLDRKMGKPHDCFLYPVCYHDHYHGIEQTVREDVCHDDEWNDNLDELEFYDLSCTRKYYLENYYSQKKEILMMLEHELMGLQNSIHVMRRKLSTRQDSVEILQNYSQKIKVLHHKLMELQNIQEVLRNNTYQFSIPTIWRGSFKKYTLAINSMLQELSDVEWLQIHFQEYNLPWICKLVNELLLSLQNSIQDVIRQTTDQDSFEHMKRAAQLRGDVFNAEESNLFNTAYKNGVGIKLNAWRIVSSMKAKNLSVLLNRSLLTIKKKEIATELKCMCNEAQQSVCIHTDNPKKAFHLCVIKGTEVAKRALVLDKLDKILHFELPSLVTKVSSGKTYRRRKSAYLSDEEECPEGDKVKLKIAHSRMGKTNFFGGNILLLLSLLLSSFFTLAQSSVTLHADKSVVAVGESAFFTCRGHDIASVLWVLNGTVYVDSSLMDVAATFIDSTSDLQDIGILTFHRVHPQFNNTIIQCRATLNSGVHIASNNITMVVQGTPQSVMPNYSLYKNNITISWIPSFTLDIPDVDPDVTYCVYIYNSTNTLLSECHLTNTSLQYQLPDNFACLKYNFTIGAVNIVGQTNSSSIKIINEDLDISSVDIQNLDDTENNMINIYTRQYLCMNSAFLTVQDNVNYTFKENDLVQFNMTDNQHIEATVHDSNNLESSVTFEITTYDVNITSAVEMNDDSNEVLLNTSFTPNSLARGVLYVFVRISHDAIDFSKSLYIIDGKDKAENGIIHNVSSGLYQILSYDIEKNYTIQDHGSPAYIYPELNVTGYNFEESVTKDITCGRPTVQNSSISVKCNCPAGTYYQAILQIYNGSAYNIMTRRSSCGKSTSFACPNDYVCNVIAFAENMYDGILLNPSSDITTFPFDGTTLIPSFGPKTNTIVISVSTVVGFLLLLAVVYGIWKFCLPKKSKKRKILIEWRTRIFLETMETNI